MNGLTLVTKELHECTIKKKSLFYARFMSNSFLFNILFVLYVCIVFMHLGYFISCFKIDLSTETSNVNQRHFLSLTT